MDIFQYWFMFPVAIGVATCAMLSGIGGAALFTPIFVLLFPLLGPDYVLSSTVAAIAAALITQTFGFLSGFIGYQRRGLIDNGLARRMLVISVPVAMVGALIATSINDAFLLAGYALLVLVLGAGLVRQGEPSAGQTDVPQELRFVVDRAGKEHRFVDPGRTTRGTLLTMAGAFLTGLVSVGIGEVTISQLTRRGVPIAVAAATSVLVVIVTVATASTTLAVQLIREGGLSAIPWNLLLWDIPGVLIGGQIGPRLQGRIRQITMQRAIGALFFLLSIAMAYVAWLRFQGGSLH
ncbi:MAG: sulfite exporter TauE/SafE family protein [Pseudomonadota bacterium]